jgi:hypothetical protein
MVSGQFPKYRWRPNLEGQIRTLEEAVVIAERFGVRIPEDVAFFVDELGDLDADTTARGPQVTKPAGGTVTWSDFVHDRTGKVPFRIRPDILESDEAIIAVFAHEMFELEKLRPILEEGKTSIEQFIELTRPGNPRNYHDEAWTIADEMVERFREHPK